MQERQHLRSLVDRIENLRPNIVLVEKSVSQLARGYLLDAGIAVVFNVKAKVMERLARSTQATIVMAIDQLQFDLVRLGTCEHFKLTEYLLLNGKAKTLMSFEGCSEALGCTVILHGDKRQLPVVKQLLSTAVVTAYSLLMERYLQLDMFAMPPPFDPALYCEVESTLDSKASKVSTPTLYPCIPDDEYRSLCPLENLEEELSGDLTSGNVQDKEVNFKDDDVGRNSDDSSKELKGKQGTVDGEKAAKTDTNDEGITGEQTSSQPAEQQQEETTENIDKKPAVGLDIQTVEQHSGSVTGSGSVDSRPVPPDPSWTIDPSEVGEGSVDAASIGDISSTKSLLEDQLVCSPLLRSIARGTQFIVSTDDKSYQSDVSISHLLPERPSCFLRCLMQVLLTLSPHITIPLPYVETAAGSMSNIRPFIPNVVYFSKRFKPQKEQAAMAGCSTIRQLSCASPADSEVHEEVDWGEPHPFITEVIKEPITEPSCAARLANFRAVGGRVGVHAPVSGGQVHFFSISNQSDERKFSKDVRKSLSYSGSLHPDGSVQAANFQQTLPGRNPTQPSIPRPVKYERKVQAIINQINFLNFVSHYILFCRLTALISTIIRGFLSCSAAGHLFLTMLLTLVSTHRKPLSLFTSKAMSSSL